MLPALHFSRGAHECLHTYFALDAHGLLVGLKLAPLGGLVLLQVALAGHLGLLAVAAAHGGWIRRRRWPLRALSSSALRPPPRRSALGLWFTG